MRLLATVEPGLFATQPTLGLGDLHALAGTKPDQVGLELSHHRKHIDHQPADRVGGVVDRPAQVQSDLAGSQLIRNRARVGQ